MFGAKSTSSMFGSKPVASSGANLFGNNSKPNEEPASTGTASLFASGAKTIPLGGAGAQPG